MILIPVPYFEKMRADPLARGSYIVSGYAPADSYEWSVGELPENVLGELPQKHSPFLRELDIARFCGSWTTPAYVEHSPFLRELDNSFAIRTSPTTTSNGRPGPPSPSRPHDPSHPVVLPLLASSDQSLEGTCIVDRSSRLPGIRSCSVNVRRRRRRSCPCARFRGLHLFVSIPTNNCYQYRHPMLLHSPMHWETGHGERLGTPFGFFRPGCGCTP